MNKPPVLLGPDGKPLRAVKANQFTSGFDAASTGRRMKNFKPPSAAINGLINGSLSRTRDRARDQVRNIPWMRRADRSFVANVVGNGIRPIPKGGDKDFREAVKEAWDMWAMEADADGRLDFYGLQALIVRSVYQSGEVLVRKIYRPTDDFNLLIPFQLKVLEADHLDHTYNMHLSNGGKIVQGIEFDNYDRIAAYHLWKEHPNEMIGIRDPARRVRIPADEIMHIFEVERPGQTRGFPKVASSILRMLDLMEYEDAELVRKKFAAYLTFFITSPADDERSVLDEEIAEALAGGDESKPFETDLEPGTGLYLDPGQEVKTAEPADVGSNYDPFVKMNLRAAAAGADVMYEAMTGDLSGVTFSSIRWGLNESQRIWEQFQNQLLVAQFCMPVWREFMVESFKAGLFEASDFAFNPRPYLKVKWLTPGWPYVNPQQEAAADKIAVRSGFISRTRVAGRRGYDVAEIDDENAADLSRAQSLNLIYDTDPRAVSHNGVLQNRQSEDPDKAEREDQDADETDSIQTE
ncbi:MAG: phage portal protein [Micavibrio aeruginosavorus]|uniref:Phage portal protein n=1 Tax=Micavibrio aeruginosavorus TaxID=349221 RepID=A0A7T5UIB8_9BACT|nr:MAG: phage portal protein [Micavibrio aeruginosavorus]